MKIPKDKIGEMGVEPQYVPLTTEEVRTIAMDLLSGQMFASWQIAERDQHLTGTIFMPLMMIDDLTVKAWKRDGVNHLVGHMRDTVARSINGYPIFHTFKAITTEDANRIISMAKKMQNAITEMEEDG